MSDCPRFSSSLLSLVWFHRSKSLSAGQSFIHLVFAYTPTFIHSFIHAHSFIQIFACKTSTVFTSSGKMTILLIALLQFSLLFRNVISTCSTTSDVEFTFYGFPDGSSDTTSFGCSGTTKVADGTAGGSFQLLPLPRGLHSFPSPTDNKSQATAVTLTPRPSLPL